jgi:hypothetical protein
MIKMYLYLFQYVYLYHYISFKLILNYKQNII